MATKLSSRDLEEMKPYLDKTIYKFLGFNEPALVNIASNCLMSGYDKHKASKALATLLDEHKASKLADKIYDLASSAKHWSKSSRKRSKDDSRDEDLAKKQKLMEGNPVAPPLPMVNHLSSQQIKEMMSNAQKALGDRKRSLEEITSRSEQVKTTKVLGAPPPNRLTAEFSKNDKLNKLAMLKANINNQLASGLINNVLGPNASDKPTPLILDSQGRTVDITGKEIQLTHVTPTLKANIRAKKREEFKAQLNQTTPESISDAHFFDPRLDIKPSVRNKRALRFHEPGKFQQLAEKIRKTAKLNKLQDEIFQISKKTGISSAAKLALIAPKQTTEEEQIPDVEWWDSVIALDGYGADDEVGPIQLQPNIISHLVEHPTQMRPPTEPFKPIYLPVFLTKKERKKLRRQNRREGWKEEQEKVRLGLEPPPEPKLRISNLMRVLGTEAVQDPTKVEAHVRAQMAKRQKAHEDANAARKLTGEQRKEKKIRKLQEDTSLGVHVAVYRVTELANQSKKFKVETNAKQLFLTGCVVLFKDCNVVVVEGGPKQINKYNRLMTHRIKWEEDALKGDNPKNETNKCVLVWKGTVKQRSFGEMKFKVCPSEKLARDHLKKNGVEHYWDLAYSGTVLDHTEDLF